MLEVIRSFSLQNRIVAFVSWEQLAALPAPTKVGDLLVDDNGREFVLTGLASPRGDKHHEAAIVLRSADGKKGEPIGHLRAAE